MNKDPGISVLQQGRSSLPVTQVDQPSIWASGWLIDQEWSMLGIIAPPPMRLYRGCLLKNYNSEEVLRQKRGGGEKKWSRCQRKIPPNPSFERWALGLWAALPRILPLEFLENSRSCAPKIQKNTFLLTIQWHFQFPLLNAATFWKSDRPALILSIMIHWGSAWNLFHRIIES